MLIVSDVNSFFPQNVKYQSLLGNPSTTASTIHPLKLQKGENMNKRIRMISLKHFLVLTGVSLLFCNSIILFITFLYALFNNNQVTITINTFNESVVELIIIPATLLLGFYALYQIFKELPKGDINER